MIALVLLGCGGGEPAAVPRPPGVPDGAAAVRYSGNDLVLDQNPVAPWKELGAGELERPFEPLTEALATRLTKEAGTWIALPGNATWSEARRAVHTVFDASAGPIWLGALGTNEAFGPLDNRPPSRPVLSCPEGPAEVVGFAGRLTLELHADADQHWALAHVRFKPRIRRADAEPGSEPVVAELLPTACWAPTTCEALGAQALVDACREGAATLDEVSDRVEVGGEIGCVLPLGKGADGHVLWRNALGKSLAGLGLGASTGAMVMADENVSLGAVLSILGGLADHGIRNPQLGLLRMGSADGAPTCTATVRDEAALQLAGARWFGRQLGTMGNR